MATRLVNVRLDAERLRKVKRLREHGIALAEVVRAAVDDRYRTLEPTTAAPFDVEAMLSRIYERFPDPPGQPTRDYDVADAHAARAAIVAHLIRKK